MIEYAERPRYDQMIEIRAQRMKRLIKAGHGPSIKQHFADLAEKHAQANAKRKADAEAS